MRNRIIRSTACGRAAFFMFALPCAATACAPAAERDLVVVNARVWTGNPQAPAADAFLVRDGRFIYVGAEEAARSRAREGARVVDAEGRRIIPGIIDAHIHLLGGGIQLGRLDLRQAANRAEFVRLIADRAADGGDAWVLGGRWSTESWPDPTQPDKSWIDAVTKRSPVLLHRMDGHAALANSAALKRAGIDANGPPDPPGGRIERDPATGEPTGILKESAIDLVSRRVPRESRAELDEALRRAMRHANAHGITCVHTMEDWAAHEVFDRARRGGELTLRIRQYLSEPDWIGMLPRVEASRKDDWLRIVGFKEYADGSLGSRTAYMAAPYADNPPDQREWRGLLREAMLDRPALERMCQAAYDASYTPAIHAIGDQANHEVLNLYGRLPRDGRVRGPSGVMTNRGRPRIEHAQHLLPADIGRFKELGVTASMQPLHKADDARYCEQAIGPERRITSYAYRALLDAGALVAFGSDWPVVSLDPFQGMHAAVTAKSVDGHIFVPEQRITVAEALTAYTRDAALACGDEPLGMIADQQFADFVILDRDALTVPPDEIDDVRVVATYVGGVKRWGVEDGNEIASR